jgi:hypothetical protein
MVKFQIYLEDVDFRMLQLLAEKELRDYRQQAAMAIRESLIWRGLFIPGGKQEEINTTVQKQPCPAESR